ncbi:MAG: GNAT family N-acetyltransferase [Oscillospiraceae bacterium]|jgi:predicted N-acetyltransferase YhbS|nr:GNAT family N-acetyltransferase [Oscillospiraceae bacterium]
MAERFITPEDYDAVLRVWQACFGDEARYVRFFWTQCFLSGLCRGLCAEEDGQVVSVLFLLPGALAHKTMRLAAEYVYAVATLPAHRGRGYAGALTRRAAVVAREEGKSALCLLPASQGLYDYYAKLGFCTAFALQNFGYANPNAQGNLLPRNGDLHEYYVRRGTVWGAQGYFAWGAHLLEYMRAEHLFTGGTIHADGYLNDDGTFKERCENCPANAPGGMLLPLDRRAGRWLRRTKGKGYLGFPLS